jgi:heme exporter protein A
MIQGLAGAALCVERGGRPLFEGVGFALGAGELLSITGPNGAGKTTLLRLVAGLTRPARGELTFAGADGPLDAEDARAGGLHLIGHRDGLRSHRDAGEELAFWSAYGGGGAGDLARAVEAFGLQRLLPLPVAALSAGQRRRLALARLLAAPRALWLLDEPMAPLDAAMRERLAALLAAHLAAGGLVLAAVHDPLPLKGARLALTGR